MRRVRYSAATSLDGYIAGQNGEHDWIVMDPALDFRSYFAQFDTVLIGRKTYEASIEQHGGGGSMPGMSALVFSRTLRAKDHPRITLVSDSAADAVAALKAAPGKDIWLMGGGGLFRSLLDADLVDTVEVAVMPVLLGRGVPLIEPGDRRAKLKLVESRQLPTGTVQSIYEVARGARQAARSKPARAASKRAKE